MDPITRLLMQGAAGAGEKVYVEDVFSTYLYTGNGSTQTITNGIDLSGKGGLVWIKGRSGATNHRLFDTAQGATNFLESNTTNAQQSSAASLTSFNSSGFSIGASSPINTSSSTYASWTFRKAEKFFDVVTYTGNNVNGRQIAHNLGSVPGCIIIKKTGDVDNWIVYHRSLGNTKKIYLNSTGPESSFGVWNSTSPTSTHFTVSNDGEVNAGTTYVAYLFAHNAGGFGDSGNDNVVSCGSYTGTGSPGLAVTLGFEPQWVMVKNASSASFTGWFMFDNMRGMAVGDGDPYLYAQSSGAEAGATLDYINPTATGFTLTNTSQVINESGVNYIYIAIRRGPMKTPTDATKVFNAVTYTGTGTNSRVYTGAGFPVDGLIIADRDRISGYIVFADRLRGGKVHQIIPSTAAEDVSGNNYISNLDSMDGYTGGTSDSSQLNISGIKLVDYFFRRAPGFFDAVCYTGTGSARTVSHNLGVTPELMIVKIRNDVYSWAVYTAARGASEYMLLNQTGASSSAINFWNNTEPTSSVFSVSTAFGVNGNTNTYIAYLFATLTGVSKVGSYTGTGTTQQINCGFTAGARFVLIKRTDSTGDWYVWDSARGIVAGNDPYLLLNSTAAEVTSTDYVDTFSSGFEISSTAPAAINASGGSFIFLAIA